MYNYPMSKTITSPQYLLLYTTEPMSLVGKKNWYCQGIYDSEEQALAGLLSMGESLYFAHARIVCAPLPTVSLPDDFETIIGEPTHV